MITLTRREARRLRAVFRRSALGIPHRGITSPLVLQANPGLGLRARFQKPYAAVECVVRDSHPCEEAVSLPLDALGDFEGRDDSPVELEPAEDGGTVARWADHGIPQARVYEKTWPVPPPFPAPPPAFSPAGTELLDALEAAADTGCDDSPRYALDAIQLRGKLGEVVATDGRQLLVQSGFDFPWEGDLLVRRTPLFGSSALPRHKPVELGKGDNHVVLKAGPWTLYLWVDDKARFPRTDDVPPEERDITSRLCLDPATRCSWPMRSSGCRAARGRTPR